MIEIVMDRSDVNSASLSVLEFQGLPWAPQRIYWLSNFVKGSTRGNHAHKTLSQIFVAVSGSVQIEIYQGIQRMSFNLSQGSSGLLLEPGAWRIISNASEDALVMVLADAPYDESDYIRNLDDYLAWHQHEKGAK
jgi:dTDP-4-dehydrorhamnose 3,5-epimerase-like enzyme